MMMLKEVEGLRHEEFGRASEVEALARSCIELPGNGIEFGLSESGKVCALGEILPEQAVGVLVDAALPGAVRIGEVDIAAGHLGEPFVLRHLVSLIVSQGESALRVDTVEDGTFSHRLPADLVVTNPEHRKIAEQLWSLPEGTIPDKPGLHAVAMVRALKNGKVNFYWQQCNNNMQAGPNINEELYPGWRKPEDFIVVYDPYPTVSATTADLVLPTAMWVEKEGAYGNAERRIQFWRQQLKAPGESRSDLWQMMEFSKRFKVEAVWPADLVAKAPKHKGKTLYDVFFANGVADKYKVSETAAGFDRRIQVLRLLCPEGALRRVCGFRSRQRRVTIKSHFCPATHSWVLPSWWIISPGQGERSRRLRCTRRALALGTRSASWSRLFTQV